MSWTTILTVNSHLMPPRLISDSDLISSLSAKYHGIPINLQSFKKYIIKISHYLFSWPGIALDRPSIHRNPSCRQKTSQLWKPISNFFAMLLVVLFTATGAARGVSGHTGESAGWLLSFSRLCFHTRQAQQGAPQPVLQPRATPARRDELW